MTWLVLTSKYRPTHMPSFHHSVAVLPFRSLATVTVAGENGNVGNVFPYTLHMKRPERWLVARLRQNGNGMVETRGKSASRDGSIDKYFHSIDFMCEHEQRLAAVSVRRDANATIRFNEDRQLCWQSAAVALPTVYDMCRQHCCWLLPPSAPSVSRRVPIYTFCCSVSL